MSEFVTEWDGTNAAYSIVLDYRSPETGREWRLSVQHEPTKRVSRTGDKPTHDEIGHCVMRLGYIPPIVLLDLFGTLAEIAEVE